VARLFAALAAALRPSVAEGAIYSKLQAGAKCSDYLIHDVATKDDCFNAAASMVGIGEMKKLQINGVGFNGCAVNTVAKILIWSVSPDATPDTSVALPTLEYICDGVPTTPLTTTMLLTTTVLTTTTRGVYTRLQGGSTCHSYGVPDVSDSTMCFELAAASVGLAGERKMELDNIGFTGCVFNSAANVLLYGATSNANGESNLVLPNFEYLCNGIPQTSMTATTVSSTTSTTIAYSMLTGGAKCWDEQLPNVGSREECFGEAAQALGLVGKPQMEVHGNGFTGCLFNSVANALLWGETAGVTPQSTLALPMWQYVCMGHVSPTILIP